VRTCKPSPFPEKPQGRDYASAATKPAQPIPTPVATRPVPTSPPCPVVPGEDIDIDIKEVHLPLPKLFPPRYQASVPGPPRTANWNPAPLLPGMIPSAISQNTEEFDNWAQSAHIASNFMMLQQVHKYVCYVNEIAPGARSPLMNHVLTNWRLSSWIPEEQQSAQGLH
jgi:hypothetical protein